MFFSIITKNLNREILTRNLVTFKSGMGLKMRFYYYGRSRKNMIFGGSQKPIYRGELPKKGGFGSLQI